MNEPSDELREAFDPAAFRALGHEMIDRLADHLSARFAGRGGAVLPWIDPDEAVEGWPPDFAGGADPVGILQRVIDESNHLLDPRYIGHQVTPGLPLASLAHLVGGFLNSAAAVYEMGPVVTAMERTLVRWLGAKLGWAPGCDGILTSGGSLGNLTALLAARQAKAGFDVWSEGEAGGVPLAVLVGAQSHYSVTRAVQILGLGKHGAVPVPVDERYRLRADQLERVYREVEAEGRKPIAVVASCCSTATGSFDPLEPIAEFCERRGLWLHVDGAHGAAAALSPVERHRLTGIERADSVVWDAHKMMLLPALCTAVLFRDGRRSYETFAQEASYLLHRRNPADEWYNLCGRTLECTKPMMALPLYLALATYGKRIFGDHVTSRFALGRRFAEMVEAEDDFELAVPPEANIVCFRYRPPVTTDLDALQPRIRQAILDEGSYYLVQTRLDTGTWLRVTIIHPTTGEEELGGLLAAVRRHGSRLARS